MFGEVIKEGWKPSEEIVFAYAKYFNLENDSINEEVKSLLKKALTTPTS